MLPIQFSSEIGFVHLLRELLCLGTIHHAMKPLTRHGNVTDLEEGT